MFTLGYFFRLCRFRELAGRGHGRGWARLGPRAASRHDVIGELVYRRSVKNSWPLLLALRSRLSRRLWSCGVRLVAFGCNSSNTLKSGVPLIGGTPGLRVRSARCGFRNFRRRWPIAQRSALCSALRCSLSRQLAYGYGRANLAKILSCRIDPPTSLVYGGWHGKGRKKETEPRNAKVRALNR